MFVVVDSNRVFSALLSKGRVFTAFDANRLLDKFKFISPEFMLFEIERHKDDICERSKLSSEELDKVFSFIKEEIEFIPFDEFNMYTEEASHLIPHPKDLQYFSLALAFDCPIWSEEVAFKRQSKVKVFNTDELTKLLFSK